VRPAKCNSRAYAERVVWYIAWRSLTTKMLIKSHPIAIHAYCGALNLLLKKPRELSWQKNNLSYDYAMSMPALHLSAISQGFSELQAFDHRRLGSLEWFCSGVNSCPLSDYTSFDFMTIDMINERIASHTKEWENKLFLIFHIWKWYWRHFFNFFSFSKFITWQLNACHFCYISAI